MDAQHAEFVRNRFPAMPIAGAIAWTAIGIAGAVLSLVGAVWALFIGTGLIFYLGLLRGPSVSGHLLPLFFGPVLSVHDKEASDDRFIHALEMIEGTDPDPRPLVKKAMDMARRATGKRNAALNRAAIEVAEVLAESEEEGRAWIGRHAGMRCPGWRSPSRLP